MKTNLLLLIVLSYSWNCVLWLLNTNLYANGYV